LADSRLVYDEIRRECPEGPNLTIDIDARSSRQLYSGARSASTIAGDSIQHADYEGRAVVNTEGTKRVLIYAGLVTL
jgi:hypothetical protein